MPPAQERPTLRAQLEAVSVAVKSVTQTPLTMALHGPAVLERVLALQASMVSAIEQLQLIATSEYPVIDDIERDALADLEDAAYELRHANSERRES